MEREEEALPVPPDELRCIRSDGRQWRCKNPAISGKHHCVVHINLPSVKKNPKVLDNYVSTLDDSTPMSTRLRRRVKSEPIDDAYNTPDMARASAEWSRGDVTVALSAGDFGLGMECDSVTVARVGDDLGWEKARDSVTVARVEGDFVTAVRAEVDLGLEKARDSVNVARDSVTVARAEGEFVTTVPAEADLGLEKARDSVKVAREASEVVPEEVRCNRKDGRTWRCKRQAVEGKKFCEIHLSRMKVAKSQKGLSMPRPRVKRPAEMEVVECVRAADVAAMRGPRTKRVILSSDVEERENGNGEAKAMVTEKSKSKSKPKDKFKVECAKAADVGTMQGPRTKRLGLSSDVEGGENGNGETRVKVTEESVGGSKSKSKLNDRFVVEEGLPDEVRCTRNDGKDWRCKRRVFEGQNLCEAHFKGIKLIDVKAKEREKTVKKKRKKTKEVMIKQEVDSEKEDGNQLEKRGRKESEDEWRCKRTDGRGWRCKRMVANGKTMCELHYEQGRLRQKKITVPESLKIQRGEGEGGEERFERKLKRKRALEILENNSDIGMKKMKAELIRMFLRREIIEQNKKSEKGVVSNGHCGEITRDLPYGLMAIPPATPSQIFDNVGSLGIKIGVNSSNSLVKRRFRSKNIEPLPVGTLKAVPFAANVAKVKNGGMRKCHWCQNGDKASLTKCLSCKKLFFCSKCIKGRDTNPEDVAVKCPACCGTCDCKACCTTQTKDEIMKENFMESKFRQLQYLIKSLLPILEQINQDQSLQTATEARFKGKNLSEVEIRQSDVGYRNQCYCNNCKSPILDFHRSCPNCSYNLCLSCCREYSQGGCLRGTESFCSQPLNGMKTDHPSWRISSEKILKNSNVHNTGNTDLAAAGALSESIPALSISCPPMELGGCDNSLLDLRCIFPLNWIKELENSAKEAVSGLELPQTTNDSSDCSICASIFQAANKNKLVQEASRRAQSHDNFLYCPISSDDHYNVLSHFRKHWCKGHPVKVRNVLQCASALTWDPLTLFCNCLDKHPNIGVNRKSATEVENCTDWYEVEIGRGELFARSPEEGCTHRWHKTLRVKAKFSSSFSRVLLGDHYSEIIHALPLQEYTNPRSGLLNIAGKLPEDLPESNLGPHVSISFGTREILARGELVTKLHYNSYDVVNILTHVADATCSMEKLNQVSYLIRRSNGNNEKSQNLENVDARNYNEICGVLGGNAQVSEGIALSNGVGASCCSPVANNIPVSLPDDKTSAKLDIYYTNNTSGFCSETIDDVSHRERLESSRLSDKRPSNPCGARWDVFRRKDIPKLVEYITKHAEEFNFSCDFPENVVHSIYDGRFYLDSTHKIQLKEEFDIEPWTFNQCLGEAVFIPAGCPYQIMNVQSCINLAVGFISPENALECINLIKEIQTLPNNNKAKETRVEVEKMTICSIDEAIKEIYRLRSEESSILDKGIEILAPNS